MTEEEEILTPEYGDLYLKFTDEQEANDILADYQGSKDIIGPIEGIEGWHVNTRGPKDFDLLPFAVEVLSPVRVWA